MTEVAIKLTTGTVVNRAELNRVKSEDLATVMADIYSTPGAQVVVVDDIKRFFSDKNLLAALDENHPTLPLILEHRGVTMTDEDLETVAQFAEVKSHIQSILQAMIPPPPPYPFADVPDGWSVATHVTFGKNFIRRTKGDSDHRATPNTVRRLWNYAATRWAAGRDGRSVMDQQSYNGYYKNAEVYADHVQIGCQRFERYELEQLAVHMEWDFPAVPTA